MGLTCVCSSGLCSPQPVHFVCLFIQTCIVVHWKPLNFQWFSSFCPKPGNRKKHSLDRTDNKWTFWNVVMDQLCCWTRALEGKQGRGLPEVQYFQGVAGFFSAENVQRYDIFCFLDHTHPSICLKLNWNHNDLMRIGFSSSPYFTESESPSWKCDNKQKFGAQFWKFICTCAENSRLGIKIGLNYFFPVLIIQLGLIIFLKHISTGNRLHQG